MKGGAVYDVAAGADAIRGATRMRLQMLANSLRSKRGSFLLAARIIRTTFFWLWDWPSAAGWAFRHFR